MMTSWSAFGCFGWPAARMIAAALVCVVAACGGGGGGSDSQPPPAPPPPPPATGAVTIPAGSEIVALGVGDADQIIYALPGESAAQRLELINNDAAARYDVTVTDGSAFMSAVEADGRWVLVVASQAFTAGTSHAYRVQVCNRTTGRLAEIYGPMKVLTRAVAPTVQITSAGGSIAIGADGRVFRQGGIDHSANQRDRHDQASVLTRSVGASVCDACALKPQTRFSVLARSSGDSVVFDLVRTHGVRNYNA